MMRPRHYEKARAPLVCVLVSCLLLGELQAQATLGQPGNLSNGNSMPVASTLPKEMWNSGQLAQPPAPENSRVGANQLNSPNSAAAGLRPSGSTRITGQNAVTAAWDSPPGNTPIPANVVSANHEIPRAGSRTLLPPKSKADEATKPKAGSSTLQMVISLGSSLAIVIGLFLGVAVLYRKSISTTLGRGLPKNVLQVLGKTTVAPRQQLLLLRFGSKLVLVSMVQGEARAISEITDPLEVDQLAGLCEGQQAGSMTQSFREILTQGAKA